MQIFIYKYSFSYTELIVKKMDKKKKNKNKKKVTLSIDSDIYEKYQKFCEEHGLMLSKKVELFMKKGAEESEE